jgi:hypothetical protein
MAVPNKVVDWMTDTLVVKCEICEVPSTKDSIILRKDFGQLSELLSYLTSVA